MRSRVRSWLWLPAFWLGVVLCGCAQTRYVPVCSQHGGVSSSHVTDRDDQYATWDYICKDGTQQRPLQVEDPNGKYRLMVPADR